MALPDFTTQDPATYKANIDSSMDAALVISDAQTIITNTDTEVPTSGAVYDKVGGLNTKVIEIGDWNMDAFVGVSGITHGLTLSKIRSVSAIIRNDTDNNYRDFQSFTSNETSVHRIEFNSSTINMFRGTLGAFDTTDYDSTSYNRGWITILYTD